MPIYEYTCEKCGHAFEHLARTLADVAEKCPKCGAAKVSKGFSSFAARVPTGASKTCDSCSTSPACPAAGKGGCGCGCGH
jgi:putative FmdB family regulatory protein